LKKAFSETYVLIYGLFQDWLAEHKTDDEEQNKNLGKLLDKWRVPLPK